MYHYITLGDAKIYMTGVGILFFIIVFFLTTRTYAKKYRLNIQAFSHRFPFYILFLYLIAQYSWYLIEQHTILPMSISQLLLYLSPYNYPFHLVGILGGMIFIRRHFRTYAEPNERKHTLWLDTFFHAFALACIPLGIFLLLGDNFIGVTTQTSFYVSAIRSDSAMAVYDKVIPLGSLLAFLGLIAHLGLTRLSSKKNTQRYIYVFYACFCLGLMVILFLQQYPRHFVSSRGGITMDIKQYILLILVLYFMWKQRSVNKHTPSEQEIQDMTAAH